MAVVRTALYIQDLLGPLHEAYVDFHYQHGRNLKNDPDLTRVLRETITKVLETNLALGIMWGLYVGDYSTSRAVNVNGKWEPNCAVRVSIDLYDVRFIIDLSSVGPVLSMEDVA
ncbi:glycosyltransferase [Burkholderia phage BcepSauron]|uniref:Glycosyltransferase n=2 Tax=Sarumanvirus TaxID=2843450 RepID=A0A482MN98_9CAUD|nr:hypothetical protein H1O16_gp311 [Burkholderia phage BcepSaruman]YP_009904690.1 glycosyltransferase [Burkholderia phage BcepSauron]QBQ74692.1 glycosyltransferase [Burkholderia phage BcepSauron]QBX06724.1 hypothetical protein BcepSaruman_311 [Burkholderia phage BcepSaruman]